MPAKSPIVANDAAEKLKAVGQQIRVHRKALGISATAAAEAAGMSRVTLHRIERGQPAVTTGAYFNAAAVLGLHVGIIEPADNSAETTDDSRRGWIPARVRLADYPQLKQLAWQVHGADELTPREALGLYERDWRHVDTQALTSREKYLIDALRLALG